MDKGCDSRDGGDADPPENVDKQPKPRPQLTFLAPTPQERQPRSPSRACTIAVLADEQAGCHTFAVLVVSMTEHALADHTGEGADAARPAPAVVGRRGRGRRMVRVGGVQGVLVRRGGGWVLDNDSEVRLWEALSGERGARTRLGALAAMLDAGFGSGRLLPRVNGRLSAIAGVEDPDKVCLVPVAGELLGPVAYACACLNDEKSWRWLVWALSARLDASLVRGIMWGPGWQSMHCRRGRGFDRDAHWVSEMPQSFWDRLSAHPQQQLRMAALASDPAARRGVLNDLAHQPSAGREVNDLVASNPRTPNKALAHLAARFGHGADRLVWRVAQNRRAGPDLLSRLADDRRREVRWLVAAHPAAPPQVLETLAGDDDLDVRMQAAWNSSTPAAALRRLAADEILRVRMGVASNPSTPQDVLAALLGDPYAAARSGAAANPNTAAHLAETLAADRAVTVRRAVAGRARRGEVLAALAQDPHWSVRARAAANRAAPVAVLESLAKDRSEGVRASVAGHPNTPADALAALAADTDAWPRYFVASNPNTAASLLAALAADTDEYVRHGVARNAAAPARLLKKLAADADEYVRCEVARQAAAAPELLEALAGDESWRVRGSVSGNERASEDLLARLARDDDAYVRGSVCNNASAPEGLVDALRRDGDYWVRARAAAAIERREQQGAPQRH